MLLVPRFKDLTIPSVSLPGLFFPLLLLFAQHVKKKKNQIVTMKRGASYKVLKKPEQQRRPPGAAAEQPRSPGTGRLLGAEPTRGPGGSARPREAALGPPPGGGQQRDTGGPAPCPRRPGSPGGGQSPRRSPSRTPAAPDGASVPGAAVLPPSSQNG